MKYVGVMTGTSVDGLDLALIEPDSQIQPLVAETIAFPDRLRNSLVSLLTRGDDELKRLGAADVALGRFIAESVDQFLESVGCSKNQVRAIGSHGQTIHHAPNENYPFTIQIGDANVIAERTGLDVIADFRRRDMAAGGQGAPLVVDYHQALFGSQSVSRTILNIGGIANISLLPGKAESEIYGFDTGPGNALIDAWAQRNGQGQIDMNGEWARHGKIQDILLDILLQDHYYSITPPKSTGKEYFNLDYLENKLHQLPSLDPADVQATITELTAVTVAEATRLHAQMTEEIVVCGGGRRNTFLMERLKVNCKPTRLYVAEDFSLDGDAIEAAAFGYLAWCFINRRPGNVPTVTGAIGRRVLGSLFPA